MKKFLTAVLAATALIAPLGTPARAELPELKFDQGIDVKAFLKEAKSQAAEKKLAADHVSARPLYRRTERDCARFTFGPNDAPVSEAVWLRSTEWIEECYPSGPNGGQHCHERPGFTYRERVQITLRDRQPLLPWEFDRFEVCLDGPWLDIYDRETAYDYKLVAGGSRDGDLVLSPIKKIRMRPDPAGIVAESLSSGLNLTLRDRWASYYAGEQTVLVLKLRRDVPNWFDPTLLEKEIRMETAERYAVNFLNYAGEFSQKVEAGKKYYVEWSFKRLSKISTDKLQKVGETEKVAYQPGSSLAIGR